MSLHWKVDECAVYFDRLHIRGWCFDAASQIEKVEAAFPTALSAITLASFGLPSPDVAAVINSAAKNCRFDEWIVVPTKSLGRDFKLRFTFADRTMKESESVLANAIAGDPYFACWDRFFEGLRALNSGTVLEIGSRARSSLTYRSLVPSNLAYLGLDILPGPNVDIVGDAHELEKLFGRRRFVAAFSLSVFEHLAMPWKVAIELNRVLELGGLVFTSSHQTWPLHEEPWDFWRFSEHSWPTLFNVATGFEVVTVSSGEPARIHPLRSNPATRTLPDQPAFLGCASIVRKISETTLDWPVSIESASKGRYPPGELIDPPS